MLISLDIRIKLPFDIPFSKKIRTFAPVKRLQSFLGAILPYILFLFLLPISIIAWVAITIKRLIQEIAPRRSGRGR